MHTSLHRVSEWINGWLYRSISIIIISIRIKHRYAHSVLTTHVCLQLIYAYYSSISSNMINTPRWLISSTIYQNHLHNQDHDRHHHHEQQQQNYYHIIINITIIIIMIMIIIIIIIIIIIVITTIIIIIIMITIKIILTSR
jgi:hypothetical protein